MDRQTDRTPTRVPESVAVSLTHAVYGNRSHRQSRNLSLARALLSHVAAALMPPFVSLVLARTLLFSPNATSLNAYATNYFFECLLSHSRTKPHLNVQSRAKGKATISRGVEPADHKVSRRRVADCTGTREYLVEGTVVRMLPRRIQIHSQ